MQVSFSIQGEEKTFKIKFTQARNLLKAFEASGLLELVMAVSQIKTEEEFSQKFPGMVGKFDKIFDVTEEFFKIITKGEITPDDFEDVESALVVAMHALKQIVAPLSYTLSPDNLESLKKNTLNLSDSGEENAGNSDSHNATKKVSLEPSSAE